MNLTILNVAYPFAPVGPDAVGGAEQVLSQLDHALVRAGHRSIVVACEGSIAAGQLIATPAPPGPITDDLRRRIQQGHLRAILSALRRYQIDVLHFHGIDFDAYLPPGGPPALITLHLPPGWYPPHIFHLDRPRTWLHCVSNSQRRACPPGADLLPDIPNGVPLDQLRPHRRKCDFAIALGRICPEKNFHVALDAAAQAGVPLLLAGRIFPYPEHERYFREQILPRLDGRSRRFLGPIRFDRKRRLLAAARCLLMPSLAPETSSLVAMESLACGTPVIAFPSGALSEIVEHGVTGFIASDERGMADAIARVDRIDPRACRAAAVCRFSLDRTIERYFDVYRRLAAAPALRSIQLDVEPITTTAGLQRLEPEWRQLSGEDPDATPFQSPAWLIPWWHHIGQGELCTLAVRSSGRLVGLLPLYIYTRPGSGCRELFPLGIATTDYLDGLFAPGCGNRCAAAALRYLDSIADRWDVLDLPQLRPGSPLLDVPPPSGWMEQRAESEACPVLKLPRTLDDLPARLPGNILQNLRYYRRRAAAAGEFRIDLAGPDELLDTFDALCRLHRARWSSRGMDGVLADDAVARAHRQAVPRLHAAGALRLFAMRLDGRIGAVLYALADARAARRRFYYYLGGFDPELGRLSPGTLLIGHAIEQAIAEGAEAFDFLRGREPYKYLWGAADTPTLRRRLWHGEDPARVPHRAAQPAGVLAPAAGGGSPSPTAGP